MTTAEAMEVLREANLGTCPGDGYQEEEGRHDETCLQQQNELTGGYHINGLLVKSINVFPLGFQFPALAIETLSQSEGEVCPR